MCTGNRLKVLITEQTQLERRSLLDYSEAKPMQLPPKLCNQVRSLSLFRWGTIYSAENIRRLCVFMFQTCSNSLLCTDSQYSSQQLTIGANLKHKNTQPLYIFNRENPQNSEPQNGPRSGLDYIALVTTAFFKMTVFVHKSWVSMLFCKPHWQIISHNDNMQCYGLE